jgi:integrase
MQHIATQYERLETPGEAIMSVRKRRWTTRNGEEKESWIIDYTDQQGDRHIETFAKKKDAEKRHASVAVDVDKGTHTAASKSITVAQAAQDWLKFVELEGRERATILSYRIHVDRHIVPRIGREKLAKLTTPHINRFRDDLLASVASRSLAKAVLKSFKAILKDAHRRGNVAQNVARDVIIGTTGRSKRKLKAGVDIPTPDEIRKIIHAATGRRRPLLLTAVFTGLRGSELRGLRWQDIDLNKGELHVRQRADRYNVMGKPKSHSGDRTIPLGPLVLNALKEWRLACPKGRHDLVFPNGAGNTESHANIVGRIWKPVQIKAGVVDDKGKAKYTRLHATRHFYASWCINRKKDGGLELPIKTVQSRLGHASIMLTSDVYGHLFPRTDDGSELAEAEKFLMKV